ncbi:hypothetical protein N752_27955 [Desulforamulus aquiferis]|nr:ATP-binding cassette domain-containing protein [Desulforamulus aquiferis]RYD01959.1 hypothetical protein N752_27955 [Desulforamulus aquiferis]
MAVLEAFDIKLNLSGKNILDIDSFAINEGQVTALIGANGAGKTSFMQVLSLLQNLLQEICFLREKKFIKEIF